ncbi:hypothetical protein [Candidatus Uabimicrobium amorphum]|uniref:Uncharacterized protein n=1 Tax=Uabimicrobium amorphum TaxID=2596890 RepID=A0A5S9INH4_UABAM|nr:hypothetical protein [Candidatus Uabimicrobium amorphum]BBM84676.1 hypothetical protein UABAM_03037 [Candidatus Uabimicrobium amorphum]
MNNKNEVHNQEIVKPVREQENHKFLEVPEPLPGYMADITDERFRKGLWQMIKDFLEWLLDFFT